MGKRVLGWNWKENIAKKHYVSKHCRECMKHYTLLNFKNERIALENLKNLGDCLRMLSKFIGILEATLHTF